MDIGVGSFIVASAVTSRYAKGKRLPIESLKSFVNWHTCQRITVLLLGVGRLVALRVLNYQSKDTEYGVHWNFFVTLFFVWGFTDMLHHIVPRQYLPVIAILILATYQTILCKTDLVDFILSAPRTNFFAANREGIFSLFGFVPLYILAEAASHNLFFESVITDTNGATVSKAMALTQPGNDIKIDSVPAPAKYQREGVDVTNVVVLEGNDDGNGNGNGNGDRNNDQVNAQPVAREGSKESNGSVESDTEAQAKKRERGIVYFLGYRWRRLIPQHVKKMSKRLSVFVTFLWVLWMALSAFVQPTSRRMTNMTYVIFVLAVSMTLILLTALADAIGGPSKILTLEYINDWQLPVFMVANVLTGVINLSMKTIYAPPVMAFALLSGYVTSVVGFAWLLGKGWFSRQSTKSSSI
jgi:phosphatidylinositol glycan class W